MNRRTKIVSTLGPATDTPDKLEKMLRAGVDLVRVNFSHGTIDTHRKRINAVRACADKMGRQIGILVDLNEQAGNYGHPDDGVDDQQHDSHPGGGIRCGQCHFRRH